MSSCSRTNFLNQKHLRLLVPQESADNERTAVHPLTLPPCGSVSKLIMPPDLLDGRKQRNEYVSCSRRLSI